MIPSFSEMEDQLHQIFGGYTSVVHVPLICVRCPVHCFLLELYCKIRPNFALFDPCKNWGKS